MRFLSFVFAVIVAILLMKYTDPLVRFFGKMPFAEQYLGSGGTYTAWKIVAIIIILVGLFYWLPPAFLK